MNIKNLKQDEGILCPTKKILKKILKLNNDNTGIDPDICFKEAKKVVYFPIGNFFVTEYQDFKLAKKNGNKIHSHKKFLKPSLKKRVQKIEKRLDELDRILAGNGGDWRSKSLPPMLMVSTTLDGFYFANCVLSAALLLE